MKESIIIILIILLFNTGSVFAHGAHGKISAKEAIQVAIKTTQKLTFKDFGFEVGKLNGSWKKLSKNDFKLYAVQANRYIVSASNKTNNKTIYFLMSMSGEILKANSTAEF